MPELDTTWRIVLWLIDRDFADASHEEIARALHVNRSSISRAIQALVEAKVLERREDGGLEPGMVLAQAYARRLRYWSHQHQKLQLVQQALGAELAILAGDAAEATRKPRDETADGRR